MVLQSNMVDPAIQYYQMGTKFSFFWGFWVVVMMITRGHLLEMRGCLSHVRHVKSERLPPTFDK